MFTSVSCQGPTPGAANPPPGRLPWAHLLRHCLWHVYTSVGERGGRLPRLRGALAVAHERAVDES